MVLYEAPTLTVQGQEESSVRDRPTDHKPGDGPDRARERGNRAENDWETLGPNYLLVDKSRSLISNLGLEVKSN